ncbi:MAG: adenylate/guanylate cyclase domain-containing protein [Desulfobacterales bacterium]|nr:adenylate/guanylate cyclase domain-containing protein [Desulfobacterales bacterium]
MNILNKLDIIWTFIKKQAKAAYDRIDLKNAILKGSGLNRLFPKTLLDKTKVYTDRRSGKDRRHVYDPVIDSEQRSGKDRRFPQSLLLKLRIPIFIKLASLSTFLILFIIFTISFFMLGRQKKQFTDQLVDLGQSMVRITTKNAPEKLLGEEDLALFQLLNDIAENEQVVYALITDNNNIIKAHNKIEEVGKLYSLIGGTRLFREENNIKTSIIDHNGRELLLFETPVTFQKLKIGVVRLAISQEKILESIREGKIYIIALTFVITFASILLSLGLSMYFSGPITKLSVSAKALGSGQFSNRVSIYRNDEFGDLALAFNRMAEDLELNEKVKSSFGQYVTPEIVDMILKNPDSHWMKGSKVEASVLFVDIRGFTSLSEDKTPESIVDLLNEYFSRITDSVIKHGGHLNKFVGDEAMAIFGAPISNPRHAEAAIKAAFDMREEIDQFNKTKDMDNVDIQVGIGINSGEMLAGNIGSQKKMEYTVIGDNVNVASRLTSLAKPGEILISRRTYALIKENISIKVEKRGMVAVKGKKIKINVFNVQGLNENKDA